MIYLKLEIPISVDRFSVSGSRFGNHKVALFIPNMYCDSLNNEHPTNKYKLELRADSRFLGSMALCFGSFLYSSQSVFPFFRCLNCDLETDKDVGFDFRVGPMGRP